MLNDPIRIAKGAKPTLFERACGYEYEAEKIITSDAGEKFRLPCTVRVLPDLRAILRWQARAPRHPRGWLKRQLAGLAADERAAAAPVSEAELTRLVAAVKATVADDPRFQAVLQGAAP